MNPTELARRTRVGIVHTGGRFMASPQLSRRERQAGAAPRSLYFRGRSGAFGALPSTVVADLFGMFPPRLVEFVLDQPDQLSPEVAVAEFCGASRDWAGENLSDVDTDVAAACADALFDLVDRADGGALPLFSAWREVRRPAKPLDRLAHGLLVARELRGGLHFAALRAQGLTIRQAVLLDPDSDPRRLMQIGWSKADTAAVTDQLAGEPDAADRWAHAQRLTDHAFGRCCAALGPERRSALADGITVITHEHRTPVKASGADG
jgi:hypothetical protein